MLIREDDLHAVADELARSLVHGAEFASLHECYAVLLEEVDELWDITRQKREERDILELREELIQIAAMAFKGLASLRNFVREAR